MKDYQRRGLIAIIMIFLSIATLFILEVTINQLVTNEVDKIFMKARIIGFDPDTSSWFLSIQSMMWIVFYVAFGELIYRILYIKESEHGFNKRYLPEDNYTIIEVKDLPSIAKNINKDSELSGSLADFIKKLLMQFQTSHSIGQTLNMLNAQLEMKSSVVDLNYNMIRYLSWLIPTLGFIGTVVGIANALAYAGKVNGQGATFVADLTQKLAVAFDTTFVALIMSAIVVFLMHIIQGREESNLIRVGQYCLDNFINRLYID